MAQDIGPLDWRIPIVTPEGRPTSEFQRRWATQIGNNSEIGLVQTGTGAPPSSPTPTDGAQYVDISVSPYDYYVAYNGTWHQLNDISSLLDTISNVRGSILYRGASTWQALAPGSSGQFLKTNGAGADPSWSAGGGGNLGYFRAHKNANQSYTAAGNPSTKIIFQVVDFDTLSGWSAADNYYVVPSGVNYVTITGNTQGTADTTNFWELRIAINGTDRFIYGVSENWWSVGTVTSGVVNVTAGDTIQLNVRASNNCTLLGNDTCNLSIICLG